MRRTIGVVGLTTNRNVGDYLLVEAVKHLMRAHDPDIEFVDIDVDLRYTDQLTRKPVLNFRVADIMGAFEKPMLGAVRSEKFSYRYHYEYWRVMLEWYFREQMQAVDAIVFAGGGFIKYKTQGLNYIDELILKIAHERGIPVMMNAMGVEGYSDTDIRCQQLKKVLNYDNVKVITTRDDIDTLNDRYITNPGTVTAQVGDPVFWLNEMEIVDEHRERPANPTGNRIGINLINPNNFSDYGGRISRAEVINFYRSLIAELQRHDADFTLFSNGMIVDQEFGQSLIDSMHLRQRHLHERPTTSREFVNLVADFDIIMGARMHAGITAYAIDVPVVGLIWGEKLQFLTEITGLRDRYFDETELDPVRIAELLVQNNLPAPDRARRSELRERTRKHLTGFLDTVAAGGSS